MALDVCGGLAVCTAGLVAAGVAALAWFFTLADGDVTLLLRSKIGKSVHLLKGKVVWITGASSGIGEHLAYELARAGVNLILSGTNLTNLNQVKNRCLELGSSKGIDVLALDFDICNFASHEEQVRKALDHFQKIDILVNNAGRSQRAAFCDIDMEVDKKMFDINVFGPVSLTRLVLRHFQERNYKGHVVVTSSTAGKLGAPFSATYTATKHALHGYFEALRTEAAVTGGLDITLVCPGPVRSQIRERAFLGTMGPTYQMKDSANSKLMTTERCAYLMGVAIANKLDEVWISQQPVLFLHYVAQYMPGIFRGTLVGLLFTKERIQKMRDGQ